MREMFIRCLRIVGPLRVTKECSHSFAAAPLSVLFATVGSGTVRSPDLWTSLVFLTGTRSSSDDDAYRASSHPRKEIQMADKLEQLKAKYQPKSAARVSAEASARQAQPAVDLVLEIVGADEAVEVSPLLAVTGENKRIDIRLADGGRTTEIDDVVQILVVSLAPEPYGRSRRDDDQMVFVFHIHGRGSNCAASLRTTRSRAARMNVILSPGL